MNLGSEGLLALVSPSRRSFLAPPTLRGTTSLTGPDPTQTQPGATDLAVFIAQSRVHARPRILSAAKFQGWK